jgi:hypothetical protein
MVVGERLARTAGSGHALMSASSLMALGWSVPHFAPLGTKAG